MSERVFWIIIRRPDPGDTIEKLRFITFGGGWGSNVAFIQSFPTEAAAKARLGKRPGQVVTAESVGIKL